MTLPSGGTLSLLDIYNEAQLSPTSPWYGKGANLGSYRGVQWWQDNSATGTFPSGAISVSDFYSKRSTSPVTPGYQEYLSSGTYTFTVPLYSTLTVTVKGGSGGGAGQSGNAASGGSGGDGTVSTFGKSPATVYATGDYGRGASPGGVGAAGSGSDGSPAGGAGWGSGGASGKTTVVLTNPISGGSGPSVGASVTVVVGSRGVGGAPGAYWITFPTNAGSLGSGSPGSAGSVQIWWT